MTWPKRYGGHERSAIERFVVLEELLVAGAPVAAHWIADRQSGPQILRHGTEQARELILPAIARGECFISLGMSEAGSGSDLGSVRTSAARTADGWVVNGAKLWTSHAHRSHYVSVLCRTMRDAPTRDALSLLLIDLASDGVEVQPIDLLDGDAHFSEVRFIDVHVPDSMLVGAEHEGWGLITSELSLERSGPERILSTYPVFRELIRHASKDTSVARAAGVLAAELWTLRRLSLAVAAELEAGRNPVVEAALVKDLGTQFEQRVVEVARGVVSRPPGDAGDPRLNAALAEATLASPGFTLRAGTTEIMRSIVAHAMGVGR
jgi:alkylation response protein AidB-like acyl-CoA dehydrogenase